MSENICNTSSTSTQSRTSRLKNTLVITLMQFYCLVEYAIPTSSILFLMTLYFTCKDHWDLSLIMANLMSVVTILTQFYQKALRPFLRLVFLNAQTFRDFSKKSTITSKAKSFNYINNISISRISQ